MTDDPRPFSRSRPRPRSRPWPRPGPAAYLGLGAAAALGASLALAPAALAAQPAASGVSPEAPRIAIQAGHWLAAEAPDELARIRSNGTRGGGKHEWEVTLEIARRTAALLEARGYAVEILPATVPPRYRADLFIAIHADGFHAPSASGFSVAAPRRDATGRAQAFADILAEHYHEATGLRARLPTRTMQGYYAFNTRRYTHSIDPRTPGVILEAGFLTSPRDQEILIRAPERSARGIAAAVERFLPFPLVADPEAGTP
jgi:N-acetylmuramoyl-L-alanine amidase